MFTLAHLSDPHVPSPLSGGLATLTTKRLFGYLSWRRRRISIHRAEVLEALARDLGEVAPTHIAVTGDLVNIALPSEFPAAARWLATLGPADDVSVVPGNHDTYVAIPWNRSCALWGAYMSSDGGGGDGNDGNDTAGEGAPPSGPDDFPFVRRRGPVVVVGLSSAIPTAPGWASGRLGEGQLERLGRHLASFGDEGLFRVVLIHHPPVEGDNPRRKRLVDAEGFRRVIFRHGAELILHGHDHRCSVREVEGPSGLVPVVGVPSASALAYGTKPAAQYHLYDISPAPDGSAGGWRVELRIRRYVAALNRFEDAGTRRLDLVGNQVLPVDMASAVAAGG